MNAAQILEMIHCFEAATSMATSLRFEMIGDCLSVLGKDFPDKALAVAEELESRYPAEIEPIRIWRVIGAIAASLAEQDPNLAWEWFQKSQEGWDEQRREGMLYSVLTGITRSDPATALRRADELQLKKFSFLRADASTDNQKLATLTALRAWSAGNPAHQAVLKDYILKSTLRSTYKAPNRFAQVTAWIETAAFSADDVAFFRDPSLLDLCYHIEPQETGKWIEWLERKYPDGGADKRIAQFLKDGRTKAHAQAWLDALPPEQAKVIKQRLQLK